MYRVIKKIKFISEEQISDKNWKKALSIAEDIDEFDTPFVALSIELDGLLWTGDKKLIKWLKNKSFNEIITTNEIIKLNFK
jgi:predicted nucleic acid-binding protein